MGIKNRFKMKKSDEIKITDEMLREELGDLYWFVMDKNKSEE